MQDLLHHPAVQAGLIPFLVALVTAELFLRLRLSGLAVIAGFAATVYLASDFGFEPLTQAHKIVWLGIAAAALAIPLTLLTWAHWRMLLTALTSSATLWVMWDGLQQHTPADAMLQGAGGALYVGWLVFWFDGLRDKPVAAGSAGIALGLGAGITTLLITASLLAQFSLAVGAASAAYLALQIVSNGSLPCGRSFTLPLSVIAGLASCIAIFDAHQPWYILPVLGLIPIAALIPAPEKWGVRLRSLTLSSATLSCAAGAAYLTWHPLF
ncbi:MAG: hypothetical protein EPO42_07595 [Gallionellaceae bacterium]|nr:MAG: hypothetical protein EPO42_07595 [Gallionellaceae bacterium]